jgi:hypothetical protein
MLVSAPVFSLALMTFCAAWIMAFMRVGSISELRIHSDVSRQSMQASVILAEEEQRRLFNVTRNNFAHK